MGGILAVALMLTPRVVAWADSFQFSPSITLQEVYTNNSGGGQGGPQSDVVTQVSPGFSINQSGPWSEATLNYSPIYNHYNFGTASDRIDQSLNGNGTITPIQDKLKIGFSVYATEAGASANSNTLQNNLLVASNNRILYYSGALLPHFTQRFGDVATVDAYYRLTSGNTSDQSARKAGTTSLSADNLQNDAEVIVGSGDTFGRVSAQLDFDHNVGSGSGLNSDSQIDKDFIGLQYHLNSDYALTGTAGYQRVHYNANAHSATFTNEGLIWSIGVRGTPNADSTVAISYGLQEGIYVPTVQLTYSLGPRTKITGSYLVQIQNQLESALQNLQYFGYDSQGNPIDTRTGLPFSLVNQSFGSQNVLFRDKPAQLAIVHQLERSAITLRLLYEQRSAVTGPVATNTVATVDIAYSREMSPNLNGSIDLGFTNNIASGLLVNGNNRENLIDVSFSLYWALSRTATVYLNGTLYQPVSKASTLETTTNQVVLGLRKAL